MVQPLVGSKHLPNVVSLGVHANCFNPSPTSIGSGHFHLAQRCIMGGQSPSALCQARVEFGERPRYRGALLLFEGFITPREGLFAPGGALLLFCGVVCAGSCGCSCSGRISAPRTELTGAPLHFSPSPTPRLASTRLAFCADRQRVVPLQQLPSSSCWGLSRMLMDT